MTPGVRVVEGTPEGQIRGGYREVWIRDGTPGDADQIVSAPIRKSAPRVS